MPKYALRSNQQYWSGTAPGGESCWNLDPNAALLFPSPGDLLQSAVFYGVVALGSGLEIVRLESTERWTPAGVLA